jgi:hypothetical protein
MDLWASYRQHVHDPFDWQPAVNLGSQINSTFTDGGPSYFENEGGSAPQLFFQSPRPGGFGAADIYVSELLPGGEFGPASLVPELSSSDMDNHPSISFDGLEIFLFSNRFGSMGNDLWTATRRTVFDPWFTPVSLGPIVNSEFGESQPYLASDRQTLVFTSNRPGFGGLDIWMTTRARHTP